MRSITTTRRRAPARGVLHAAPSALALTALAATLAGCGFTPQAQGPVQRSGDYAVVDSVVTIPADIDMAHPAVVRRVIRAGRSDNRVMDHLTTLTKEFGPRLTGSLASEASERWAADQFRAWGLSNVRLEHWGDIAVRFERGPSSGAIFENDAKTRDIDFTTLSWTPGTDGPARGPVVRMPQSESEFDADAIAGSWVLIPQGESQDRRGIRSVGYLMRERLTERHELRTGATDPHTGAITTNTASDAPAGPHWAGTYNYSGSMLPTWLTLDDLESGAPTGAMSIEGFHAGPIAEARYDADTGELAFTWPHPMGESKVTLTVDDGAATGQSIGGSGAVYPVALTFTGDTAPDPEQIAAAEKSNARRAILAKVLAAGPLGFISSSGDPERVWTTAKTDWRTIPLDQYEQDVEVNIRSVDYDYINSRLTDASPIELEFNLDHALTAGPIACRNVIAEIPGTVSPDEVVIVSAHLDSWDGPGSEGCIDNATGVATVMEAARLLAASGAVPARTIRFILWTGEEQGLLGSQEYVDNLTPAQRDNISAMFVEDGGTNYQGGLPAASYMVPYFTAATAPLNGLFYSQTDRDAALADDNPDNDVLAGYMNINIRNTGDALNTHSGSDHAPFNAVGIPGFYMDEIGRADYRAAWHTQRDTLDRAIPEYMEQSATAMGVIAFQIASAPTRMPRSADEWRAAQTRSPELTSPARAPEVIRDEGWMRVETAPAGG